MGLASVVVTKAVYKVEDLFEELPIHWMWWPAIGALAVGLVGYAVPRTLGVGYDNIENILGSSWPWKVVLALSVFKFISWAISLGSGTSGGTLAPLFTIGGGLGAVLGTLMTRVAPQLGVDPRVAALVGMSALFAGASRALLTSVVFAFETTLQPLGLLPLLGGCSAAYMASSFFMTNTIMTEKIVRRGIHVPSDYEADFLSRVRVKSTGLKKPVTLSQESTVESFRKWIVSGAAGSRHQGFPVIDGEGHIVGVVTRRDMLDPNAPATARIGSLISRPPVVVYDDNTLREAADLMVREEIGRLPVVSRKERRIVIGMITRSDLLSAHRQRLEEASHAE
jgi:chloride channel protein, CIC family